MIILSGVFFKGTKIFTCSGGASECIAAVAIALATPSSAPEATPTEGLPEGVSVFQRHQVVQDRVKRGREVVEDARDVVEVLVDGPEDHRLLEVDVAQSLGVEGGPT